MSQPRRSLIWPFPKQPPDDLETARLGTQLATKLLNSLTTNLHKVRVFLSGSPCATLFITLLHPAVNP